MTVEFEIEGQPLVALNGGPIYHFTPAISFAVDCRTQEEVDRLWKQPMPIDAPHRRQGRYHSSKEGSGLSHLCRAILI